MLEMAFVVGLGALITLLKAPWWLRMWLLSNPVKTDIMLGGLLMWLHWGTLGGTMAATGGALMLSLVLTFGRKLYGYKVRGKYIRGMVDVGHLVK